ncbi:MAG: guanylate kinase [Spirochaetes bacterium]|jgi:guanylate kinase|nr:guanylate kinase [Spirochaetota bacterium]
MPSERFSIVVSAPSGAGKTTIIKSLVSKDDRFEFSVSTTTRPPRRNEESARSYYFVGLEEFHEMVRRGEFIEWAEVHRNYYGTTKKEVDRIKSTGKIPIFDVDVQGARQLKGRIDDAVFIFIAPPSVESLRERLVKRDTESTEQIELRLANAIKELQDYVLYDYVIINDSVESSVESMRSIVGAEACRMHRVQSRLLRSGGTESDNTA